MALPLDEVQTALYTHRFHRYRKVAGAWTLSLKNQKGYFFTGKQPVPLTINGVQSMAMTLPETLVTHSDHEIEAGDIIYCVSAGKRTGKYWDVSSEPLYNDTVAKEQTVQLSDRTKEPLNWPFPWP
jgi:hypothetical protein